ncbi:MAG: hypothetical protein HOI88_01680 [Phycisphaerae bacterium]|jgi:hypothetical protein|nr:hypothetical protein [Phycisphaerae bacterium]
MNKIKFISITIILLTSCGCRTNNARLGNPNYLPTDWTLMSSNSWQVKSLNDNDRTLLNNFKYQIAEEREGQYFNLYGQYSPAFQQVMHSTTNRLDDSFLNLAYSSKVIPYDLSPNMNGLAETYAQNDAGIAVVNDANNRMFVDDMRRATLLDKPSMLSPFPVVQD